MGRGARSHIVISHLLDSQLSPRIGTESFRSPWRILDYVHISIADARQLLHPRLHLLND